MHSELKAGKIRDVFICRYHSTTTANQTPRESDDGADYTRVISRSVTDQPAAPAQVTLC